MKAAVPPIFRVAPFPSGSYQNDAVAVLADGGVVGQQPERFGKRLRHQQSVERVCVMGGQGFEHGNVRIDNGEFGVARCQEMGGGLRARYWHAAPAEHVLDGDFPYGCGADVNAICGIEDQAAGVCGQLRRIGDGPERNVCIE